MTTSYGLPDPDPNSQLVEPSHAELHTATNHAIQDMTLRLVALETALAQVTAPDGGIEQARLVSNTWVLPGVLITEQTNRILSPVLWNLAGRDAEFSSAKASVMLPPVGGDIEIDIVISTLLDGDAYDLSYGQTSVLTHKLVIPEGANTSSTFLPSDFVGHHSKDNWIGAAVTRIGSETGGYDLTIQLNRLL
jgi:hypothetical protein